MSLCHRRKAGRKRCQVGTMSLATSCDIMRSGAEAGGIRCHSTEGVAEERRGGGSGSGGQTSVGSGDEPGTHLGSDLRVTRHHAHSRAHIRASNDFYSLPLHSVNPSRPPQTSSRPLRARSDHSAPYLSLRASTSRIALSARYLTTFRPSPRSHGLRFEALLF